MVSAIQNYISQKLINDNKPVTFLDLCDEFSINANKAKNEMVHYYSTTRHESIQCIVICVLKQNMIKMITDPENLPESENIKDFFIYAFNPLETIDLVNKERTYVSIKNPFKLTYPDGTRPKTSDAIPTVISIPTQTQAKPSDKDSSSKLKTNPEPKNDVKKRANTFPLNEPKPKKPAKSMGLKSTELLARMRRERAEKENQRQEELERRKKQKEEEAQKKNVVISQEKQKQLDQLAHMFDDDDDLTSLGNNNNNNNSTKNNENGNNDEREDSLPVAIESIPSQEPTKQEHTTNIEELLDTTADESILELSQPVKNNPETVDVASSDTSEKQQDIEPQEVTYVDEDGYMVTKRVAPEVKKPSKTTRSSRSVQPAKESKPRSNDKKKSSDGQRTLESFFFSKSKK